MLSDFDKKILNAVQEDIPLVSCPFAAIAERLHIDEAVLMERLTVLKEKGYLRRLGAYFDSEAIGYRGALVALRVSAAYLADVVQNINRYECVTHNYEREGEYNLWFTLQTSSAEQQRKIIDEIRVLHGVERMIVLPSLKKYKVRVQFQL